MKYDFDQVIDRRESKAIKWEVKENELPMWVADMDFKVAPPIIEALRKRVEHGIFGYTEGGKEWYEACCNFFRRRYGWQIKEESLLFSLGVVPTLSSSVRALTEVGDEVVVMPPVYNIFYNSIRNSHRKIVEVPLVKKDRRYAMDFAALEKAFASPNCKLCFFCNPGNPVARIWEKEEILVLIALAKKHGVIILSDEIHGQITRPGTSYVPFLTLPGADEVGYAAVSPTKCFNMAGLHTSAIVIPNETIRAKVNRQINTDEVAEPNAFSCVAAIAAWNESEDWLDEMRSYVFANRDYAESYIEKEIPELEAYPGDATYLMWVNCGKISANAKDFLSFLRSSTGLYLSDGGIYGEGGQSFLRMNLACPRSLLEDGLRRLKAGVKAYIEQNK